MTTSLQQHNTPAMVSARLTSISLSTMTDDFYLECRYNACQHDRRYSRSRPKPPVAPEAMADQQRLRYKYRRKKERKKKNKLKKFLQHYESSDKLKIILGRIYEGRALFADVERDLPAVVAGIHDQYVFFEILNESITNYIEDLAEGIWDHLTQFTGPYHLENFIQQYEHFEDSPEFFTLLIEELCYTHEQIKSCSREVYSLIDLYVRGYCPKVKLDDQQYNLSRNTLNHLVNCNTFLTVHSYAIQFVVYQLQTFFGEHGEKLEGSEVEYQKQLRYLLQNIQLKKTSNYYDDWYDESLPVDSENSTEYECGSTLSTTVSAVDPCEASPARKSKKRKSKKKNAVAYQYQPEPSQMQQPITEEDFDRLVMYSFGQLTLPRDRLSCSFYPAWLQRLYVELTHHKHN